LPLGGALAARGIALRAAQDDDTPFLRMLFESARPDGALLAAWPAAMRKTFLDQQFKFQTVHYARVYPRAMRQLILKDSEPVGRLILEQAEPDWCLIDIALLPAARGQGFGTLLLQAIQAAAARAKASCLCLSVDMFNPARKLYERLGFLATEEAMPNVAMVWRPPAGLRR
jgi:GNAT superfamily N-acetyltransferase